MSRARFWTIPCLHRGLRLPNAGLRGFRPLLCRFSFVALLSRLACTRCPPLSHLTHDSGLPHPNTVVLFVACAHARRVSSSFSWAPESDGLSHLGTLVVHSEHGLKYRSLAFQCNTSGHGGWLHRSCCLGLCTLTPACGQSRRVLPFPFKRPQPKPQ